MAERCLANWGRFIKRQQNLFSEIPDFSRLSDTEIEYLRHRIDSFRIMNSQRIIEIPFIVAVGNSLDCHLPFSDDYGREKPETAKVEDFEGLAYVDGFKKKSNRIFLEPLPKENFLGAAGNCTFRSEDSRHILSAIKAVVHNRVVRASGKALVDSLSKKKPIFYIEKLEVLDDRDSPQPQLPNISD